MAGFLLEIQHLLTADYVEGMGHSVLPKLIILSRAVMNRDEGTGAQKGRRSFPESHMQKLALLVRLPGFSVSDCEALDCPCL